MEKLEFRWGKAGPRGKIPGVQFYHSFTFDGTDYALHDCVYMWKDGIPEPYIGKLVKIWERGEKFKKVKVHWFFRPCEISYYLKEKEVLENELFFASGKGVGVVNVNSLEAIAGKCNVVCISKDSRNPQPSDEELRNADYVFNRIFDVDNFSISDMWMDYVGELEVKFIFSRKNEIGDNSGLPHGGVDVRIDVGCKVNRDHPTMDFSKDSKSKSKDKFALSTGKVDVENLVKGSDVFEKRPLKRSSLELPNNELEESYQISSESKEKIGSSKDSSALAKHPHSNSESNSLKRRKVDQDIEIGKAKFTTKFGNDSRSYAPSKSSSNGNSATIEHSKKLVVTRRPNVERNTWLKIPWNDRMFAAQKQGTLILLQNLDPEYTSGEVEDIMWHAFSEQCTAKMVQHTAFSSPVCGQALVILRSKEVVDRVLKRLFEDCLNIQNGMPLVGGPARLPNVSKMPANFVGHLSIDKIKYKIQQKEAVSTSHYSQPNTIEFEMAMDWFLLQARSTMWWKKLYKKQADEMKELKANFKSKQKVN